MTTTLYLVASALLSAGAAGWLAYLAGRSAGRAGMADRLATAKAERDEAIAARDAALRVAEAAANGPRSEDEVIARLKGGTG